MMEREGFNLQLKFSLELLRPSQHRPCTAVQLSVFVLATAGTATAAAAAVANAHTTATQSLRGFDLVSPARLWHNSMKSGVEQ
jgi:1-aminocyclopropane-1-carboxylate deaminase/D-cysteine desulfhydrase-like pyridoxal-dependent ACC family enzyme